MIMDTNYMDTTNIWPESKGEYERLMDAILHSVQVQEDDCEPPYLNRYDSLIVETRLSSRPEMSSNGGDYNYWTAFRPSGFGVEVEDCWSCDIQRRDDHPDTFQCLVSADGLLRMSKLATLTVAAERWLHEEQGSMAALKRAIKALA